MLLIEFRHSSYSASSNQLKKLLNDLQLELDPRKVSVKFIDIDDEKYTCADCEDPLGNIVENVPSLVFIKNRNVVEIIDPADDITFLEIMSVILANEANPYRTEELVSVGGFHFNKWYFYIFGALLIALLAMLLFGFRNLKKIQS